MKGNSISPFKSLAALAAVGGGIFAVVKTRKYLEDRRGWRTWFGRHPNVVKTVNAANAAGQEFISKMKKI